MRGPTIADQLAGVQAAQGVLAALLRRERTGVGGHVAITLADAAIYHMPDAFTALTLSGFAMEAETRAGLLAFLRVPLHGWAAIGGAALLHREVLARLLGGAERPTSGRTRFADRAGRIRHFRTLVEVLRPVLATRPRAEWLARPAALDVPAAAVNDIAEAMADPETVQPACSTNTPMTRTAARC